MTFAVTVLQTAERFEARPDESVLDAAERQGVALRHGCTAGACGDCRARVVEGSVDYAEWPTALTTLEAGQGYALMCQARACSPLLISTERSLPIIAAPRRRPGRVRELRELTPQVLHLQVEIDDTSPVDFRPGQYLNVHLADGSHRSFSMAAPPRGRLLEFHIRRVPSGRYTDAVLPSLRVGDCLDLELPLGPFGLFKSEYRPLLMVANGTGIAPIKSMLESLLDDDDCPPVSLYWGMRSESDLYLDAQIRSWQGRLYDFNYVPVLSRASKDWAGRCGHVQQAAALDLPDLSEHSIYVCGSPAMIDEARAVFFAQGAQADHLHADAFTFQHLACA